MIFSPFKLMIILKLFALIKNDENPSECVWYLYYIYMTKKWLLNQEQIIKIFYSFYFFSE